MSPCLRVSASPCLPPPNNLFSRPYLEPPFISKLAPENRCHLNGLAVEGAGKPRYVTAISQSGEEANLWLLNSGTGDFSYGDLKRGSFEPVTLCPGYLRGLTFYDRLAIIGMSKPRDRNFSGLALDEKLAAKNGSPFRGLGVIDLKTGDIAHWLQLEGVITELYDLQVLPGTICPMALGFMSDEITRLISIDPQRGTIK